MRLMHKPIVKVTGENRSILAMMGACSKQLKKLGLSKDALELTDRVMSSESPHVAFQIMAEYCQLT